MLMARISRPDPLAYTMHYTDNDNDTDKQNAVRLCIHYQSVSAPVHLLHLLTCPNAYIYEF